MQWRDCRLPEARGSPAFLCSSDTGWARVATSAGSKDMKLKWTYTKVFREQEDSEHWYYYVVRITQRI